MSQSIGKVQRSARRAARRVIRINGLASTRNKPGLLPVSPATVWRWSAEGKFPSPFKIGANTTVWDLDEVEAHLAQQAALVAG